MVGRLLSFWNDVFSWAMLNFRGVIRFWCPFDSRSNGQVSQKPFQINQSFRYSAYQLVIDGRVSGGHRTNLNKSRQVTSSQPENCHSKGWVGVGWGLAGSHDTTRYAPLIRAMKNSQPNSCFDMRMQSTSWNGFLLSWYVVMQYNKQS